MERILIVEDSETQALRLRYFLEGEGYDVDSARSAEDALKQLNQALPDLMITDYHLPGIHGDELCRRIRMNVDTRGIPILMLTGEEDAHTEQWGLESGADDYLRKSEENEILLIRIQALLRKSRIQDVISASETRFAATRLLVIEDDPTYLKFVVAELSREGYQIETANTAARALERLALQPFDGVVLDLVLPDISGTEICQRLVEARRTLDRTFIILALTGRETKKDMTAVIIAGADDVVGKSRDIEIIKARLRALIRRRQLYEENQRIIAEFKEREMALLRARAEQEAAETRAAYAEQLARTNLELEAANKKLTVREEELHRKNEELEKQGHQLQEASRLKSEFLANMSHELRTPLNAIIGFSELMHDGKVGEVSEEQKEYLGDILTSGLHLLQLINDVLDLAKVEAGKMEFHPEPVDLDNLIGEVHTVLRTLMLKKRIKAEVTVDAELTGITADPAKFKQILYNYLSNAIKFSPEGGRVLIRALPQGSSHYRIEVEDHGIGIRAEDIPRLFSEFQQIDSSTAKKYQGTGLGLALTKRMVEAQGGEVGVRSTFGEGSVFYAVLPRQAMATAEGEPLPVRQASADAPLLLVINDNSDDLAWLTRVLGEAGYRTEAVMNGAKAIACCREKAYDAIVLNLLLPDVSGWQVLKAVQEKGPNSATPVIMVSVLTDKAKARTEVKAFLTKPVTREMLVRALEQAGVRGGTGNRILVVDDDPKALKLAESLLTDLGYGVLVAAGGEQGLTLLKQEKPDAVLLDLLMPEMSGFEFLEQAHRSEDCPHVPVVVWTISRSITPAQQLWLRFQPHAHAVVKISDPRGDMSLLEALHQLAPAQRADKRN
ncbi:MAG TPA: response regulator [Gammaproteobacteria bacterium]|nr:response regulator [Gammaproteobacteria bacterium]